MRRDRTSTGISSRLLESTNPTTTQSFDSRAWMALNTLSAIGPLPTITACLSSRVCRSTYRPAAASALRPMSSVSTTATQK